MAYRLLRHARVSEVEVHPDRLAPVEWVVLSHWDHDSGETEYCVEYLDSGGGDARDDGSFGSLAEAERHASREFDLTADDWREGGPAFGHPAL